MKNRWSIKRSLVFFLGSLALIPSIGWMGCGDHGTPPAGPQDTSYTATGTDAESVARAIINTALAAHTKAFPSSAKKQTHNTLLNMDALSTKYEIHASTGGSCNQEEKRDIPDPKDLKVDPLKGSVGGSCSIQASGTSENSSFRLNCDNYNNGPDTFELALNGMIGFRVVGGQVGGNSQHTLFLNTHDFMVGKVAGTNQCSATLSSNATASQTPGAANAALAIIGCEALCGEAFTLSGSTNPEAVTKPLSQGEEMDEAQPENERLQVEDEGQEKTESQGEEGFR